MIITLISKNSNLSQLSLKQNDIALEKIQIISKRPKMSMDRF